LLLCYYQFGLYSLVTICYKVSVCIPAIDKDNIMSDNTPLVIESGCEPFLADELKDFLVSDDRSLNPFFTGREDLRAEINYLSGVISKGTIVKTPSRPG